MVYYVVKDRIVVVENRRRVVSWLAGLGAMCVSGTPLCVIERLGLNLNQSW